MNIGIISNYDDSIWDTWWVDSFSTMDKIAKKKRLEELQDKTNSEHTKRFNKKHMDKI